jgi:hypothetical protein
MSDLFGTFLKSVNADKKQQVAEPNRRELGIASDAQRGIAERILAAVVERGPQSVIKLLAELDVTITDFSAALQMLRDRGLIATTGEGTAQEIALTEEARLLFPSAV